MTFTVFIEEMSKYQSEEGRYRHGEFDTYEEAVEACKRIVDEFLASCLVNKTAPEELFRTWSMFGEDPYIVPDQEPGFSAMDYVKKRCQELITK